MAGLRVVRSEPASASLLSDLRSDGGMGWLPRSGMWLTAMRLDTAAGTIIRDLSIDGGVPAGETPPVRPVTSFWVWGLGALVATTGIVAIWLLWRPSAPPFASRRDGSCSNAPHERGSEGARFRRAPKLGGRRCHRSAPVYSGPVAVLGGELAVPCTRNPL